VVGSHRGLLWDILTFTPKGWEIPTKDRQNFSDFPDVLHFTIWTWEYKYPQFSRLPQVRVVVIIIRPCCTGFVSRVRLRMESRGGVRLSTSVYPTIQPDARRSSRTFSSGTRWLSTHRHYQFCSSSRYPPLVQLGKGVNCPCAMKTQASESKCLCILKAATITFIVSWY
jgi:hypothetical protein